MQPKSDPMAMTPAAPAPEAKPAGLSLTKPLTPAEDLEVEILSTDLDVELVRRKLEKQQDLAEKKIALLLRRRRALVRALATERERGAGWTPMNGRRFDPVTGEVAP